MAEKPTMKDFPRFREPTAADDLSRCQGSCGRKVLPEELDEFGFCYSFCSEHDNEEDERKAEKNENQIHNT